MRYKLKYIFIMLQKKVATEVTNLRNGFNYIIKAHKSEM